MRRMVKFTAVCVALWVLTGACVFLRFAPIRADHADTLNRLCELGAGLVGLPALFLSSLVWVGWAGLLVGWVSKSEALPIRIVRERRPPTGSEPTQGRPGVYTYSAPGQPLCPQCDRRPAILYCLCHKLSLCLQCVGAHDRPQECSYRPNWRVVSPEAVQKETPGSAGTAQKRKTGDVFGIG